MRTYERRLRKAHADAQRLERIGESHWYDVHAVVTTDAADDDTDECVHLCDRFLSKVPGASEEEAADNARVIWPEYADYELKLELSIDAESRSEHYAYELTRRGVLANVRTRRGRHPRDRR